MTVNKTTPRPNRSICLYFCQETYETVISESVQFQEHLVCLILRHPELFPANIISGYYMKDIRKSLKLKVTIRRIIIAGISYSIRPSFVMPYMTGKTNQVEKALFLRKFAVPFWALSYCFGKYSMYWYRSFAGT